MKKPTTRKFTVKELLSRMTGVDSIGIYDVDEQWIVTHPDANELMLFVDELVDHFHVWIYDEKAKDYNGNDYDAKHIRACIYLTKTRAEYDIN